MFEKALRKINFYSSDNLEFFLQLKLKKCQCHAKIIETYEIYHKTRLQQLFFCLNCEQNFSKSSFI